MRCLRDACALVMGFLLLNVCVAAAEIAPDPIVGEWRGEGMATLERMKVDADGRWDFLDKPGQPLKLKWERKDDGYILHISEKRGAHFATLSPDGLLSLTPMDAVHVPSVEARARSAMRFRRVGAGLGSLVKARQTPLTASELVGRWEWVWSRTSVVPNPPSFHEMQFTESGDMIVTNTLITVGGTGTYRIENGRLYMQPQGGAPVPPSNIGLEGELLVMGMGDGDDALPAEHLYARVGEGHVAVPAELIGVWCQTEITNGVLLIIKFLERGNYTMSRVMPNNQKPRLLVHDRFFVRFWQSPHGPAFTRVINVPDAGGPIAMMALWKRDGDDLLLTDMRWDAANGKLEAATESARYRRVSE